ncbi:hypothetical protein SEEPB940_08748 [Salmonella enterica subsp. enterica serovar Paratyphi B str. ATCC 19940]|nr:hypothetical protein SEEPB940_08748 [Salmonella enterica subsp. enterica serovar Paratyphi B str. ATCC 19940]
MEVTASGTFSHTNMTIANTNKHKVRVMGSIFIIIQSMIYDIVSNVDREKLFPYKN